MKKITVRIASVLFSAFIFTVAAFATGCEHNNIAQTNTEGSAASLNASSEVNKESILYASCEGILDNGVKYQFHGEDEGIFNLSEFIDLWHYTVEEKLSTIEIAQTPIEAAKIGLKYIIPSPQKDDTLIISYCSDVDSWLLGLKRASLEPMAGGSNVLVVNYSDGSMIRYHNGLA